MAYAQQGYPPQAGLGKTMYYQPYVIYHAGDVIYQYGETLGFHVCTGDHVSMAPPAPRASTNQWHWVSNPNPQ